MDLPEISRLLVKLPCHLLFQCLYFLPREYTVFPGYFGLKLQRHLGFFMVPHFQLISSTCSCYFLPCCTSKLFSVGYYNLLSPYLWSPFLRLILATVLTLVVLQYYFALLTFLLRALKLLLIVNTLIGKPFNQETFCHLALPFCPNLPQAGN